MITRKTLNRLRDRQEGLFAAQCVIANQIIGRESGWCGYNHITKTELEELRKEYTEVRAAQWAADRAYREALKKMRRENPRAWLAMRAEAFALATAA